MKKLLLTCLLALAFICPMQAEKLPGFVTTPYFDEQEMSFTYSPGIKIRINAPSSASFDKSLPTRIVLYALPNGNTTDWTAGKLPASGEDWHYQIQHIAAQTRFIREKDRGHNTITVYVEADTRSWGRWRGMSPDRDETIRDAVEYICSMFSDYNPTIELNSHSGGGNFIFGYMDAVDEIPAMISHISFIDSNYNWNDDRYGAKLLKWLGASPANRLFVACYDDANGRLDGKPFISRKGGTWHHTQLMQHYLKKHIKDEKWHKTSTDSTICYSAGDGRIQFYMRKNPEHKIYHTVLVERNGFIQSVLSGTAHDGTGYTMMGAHAYDEYRQDSIAIPGALPIPPRQSGAMTGSEFCRLAENMTASDRDSLVFAEIISGNIPSWLRQPAIIIDSIPDLYGILHKVTLAVLPDFLAIGSDGDFMRIPLLPATAQQIADHYGAVLPTRRISDLIHRHSEVRLTPAPMTPDATMTTLPVFSRHDSIVEAGRRTIDLPAGHLTSGHKKDIVITNRIAGEPGRLFIYGWHYPDGRAIQPLSGAHGTGYVDYSHGVRLINNRILVDDRPTTIKQILQDPVLYRLLSDEQGPMKIIGYNL